MKGFIFDLDGTLVDSKLNFSKIRQEIGIENETPVLEYLESSNDLELIKRGHKIVRQHELNGAKNATWIPGAKELLEYLNEKSIPTAILTRNSREVTELTIEKLNIPIDLYLTRDDCRPKPHPEGLLKISEKWKMKPNELLYVGDFLFDLETAESANMPFALYYQGSNLPKFHDRAAIKINCYHKFRQGLL